MILSIKLMLARLLYLPLLICYRRSVERDKVDADAERWSRELGIDFASPVKRLVYLLMTKRQFRNLFYFRVRPRINSFRLLCPEDDTLAIAQDANKLAGGGCFF